MDFVTTLGQLSFPADRAPVLLRVVVGLLGLVLIAFGGRLGRNGPRVAVLLAGALATVAGIAAVHAADRYHQPWAYTGLVAIGAAVALWLEQLGFRAALFLAGVVTGAVLAVSVRSAFGLDPSPWTVGVGALAVGLGLPWVFETAPRFLAPLVGAVGVAWAVGYPTSLPVLIGAWALGVVVQVFTGPATLDLDGEERLEAGG